MHGGRGMDGQEDPAPTDPDRQEATPTWVKVFVGIGVALLVAFILYHLTAGGMPSHGTTGSANLVAL